MLDDLYLGIDVGSTSCKIAIINTNSEVVYHNYRKINAQPLKVLNEMLREVQSYHNKIINVGITGSARKLISKVYSIDCVKNEIISHAIATINMYPDARTIIEIGGQDSKAIFIENGMVNDFVMNKVCAAGTGSFLEWQANRLGLSMDEFNEKSLKSQNDINLDGKCGVFIESSIIKCQQRQEKVEDISMAICKKLTANYVGEFFNNREVAEPIIFQGGVATLTCMKKAFECYLNKTVEIPVYSKEMGAIGVAMIAKSQRGDLSRRFTGFDYCNEQITVMEENCSGCANSCVINVMYNKKEQIGVWGGRCGKYD